MIIDRITFTGADESVDPHSLVEISEKHPHVEWGILFGSKQSKPRYPGTAWLYDLRSSLLPKPTVKLSAHLCSGWVRSLVTGAEFSWSSAYYYISSRFQRIQLNFHGDPHTAHIDLKPMMARRGEWDLRFILQHDGVNDGLQELMPDAALLFDTSGGAGVSPDAWPAPKPDRYCGYAGGLGPQNIIGEIHRIKQVVPEGTKIWLDMERRVRSEDDRIFDLQAVRDVLEKTKDLVGKQL